MQLLSPFSKSISFSLISLLLLALISACGGGSNTITNDKIPHEDKANLPNSTYVNSFIARRWQEIKHNESTLAGVMGAEIDKSANITLVTDYTKEPSEQTTITFPSGLPGGALANGGISTNLFTIVKKTDNKIIHLLAPGKTKHVQTALWINPENPYTYGIGSIGFMLEPSRKSWPKNGTIIYKGKGLNYIVDNPSSDIKSTGYAIYTSDVEATLNFEQNTINLQIKPGGTLQTHTDNFSMKKGILNPLGLSYIVKDLNFKNDRFNFDRQNSQIYALDFFGDEAEEFTGTITTYALNTECSEIYTNECSSAQFISFSLVKQ